MSATFSFDVDTHEYRVTGGRLVPSCTSLLRSSGLVSLDHISRDLIERKSHLGREVHRACHLHNANNLGEYDPKIKPYLHAWMTFKENCKSFRMISSEYQCVATVNGMDYGMQSDVVAMIGGSEFVIELKTGKVFPHHGVQLAGYAAGLPHPKYTAPLARFTARKRIVVELRANGKPHVEPFDQKSDFEVFVSLLHMSTWKAQYEKVYREEKA